MHERVVVGETEEIAPTKIWTKESLILKLEV